MVDDVKRRILERQGYHLVGAHSGVKMCHWTKEKLATGLGCYKESFYGIASHRCLQMTPTVDACNLNCQFCWRAQDWGSDSLTVADEPAVIVKGAVEGQRKLLSGYGGDSRVPRERYVEALHPNQVAISLTGEPTLYRRLGELIETCHARGMTTFLVTNGTTPSVLRRLAEDRQLPTQLYVTVAAPNEGVYRRLAVPKSDHEWAKLRETLELLPSLDTRTVIRHTLVAGWNLGWEDEYASIDAVAQPVFVECKAYMFVGESRMRMTVDNMPSHASVREFSERLAARMGYRLAAEREDSRAVLLSEDGRTRPLDRAQLGSAFVAMA